MFSWLARFIESHPVLHRFSLSLWKRFPPRVAGFLKGLLTRNWMVGAVAVMIDESTTPPEIVLVRHTYRAKGTWGLPGGALESIADGPFDAGSSEMEGNVLEDALRREVFEELGIKIVAPQLLRIDAIPYVPEEPGPYRLDFYYRCEPHRGFSELRKTLGSDKSTGHSPEIKQVRLVPLTELHTYDLYSSDFNFFRVELDRIVPGAHGFG